MAMPTPLIVQTRWDSARMALLRACARPLQSGPPPWTLPHGVQSRIRVLWPREYQWVHSARWADQVRDALQAWVPVENASIPQPHKGTTVGVCVVDGREHQVAFDLSDYPDFLDETAARTSLVTFKLQHRPGGYPFSNVLPGGYVPSSRALYSVFPRLRRIRDRHRERFQVYGRFGLGFASAIRARAVEALEASPRVRFQGGGRRVHPLRHLEEVASAAVCLDLPGNGPFCFRLVDYLAVGACVVAPPHQARLPVPLEDGRHIVYCREDLSDLVDRCQELLDDPARRRAMVAESRAYFDRYLHHRQLGAYYLSHVLNAVEEGTASPGVREA